MFLLVILGHLSIILSLIISYIKPEINMYIIIGLMYGLYVATTLYMLIRIFRMNIIYRHRNNLISLLQY